MAKPSSQEGYDAFVRALIQFGGRDHIRKQDRSGLVSDVLAPNPFKGDGVGDLDEDDESATLADYETPSLQSVVTYAEPLAPLRPRDELALSTIFEHEKIVEIAQDVQSRLCALYPEPCWDDEPFDFLKGYL